MTIYEKLLEVQKEIGAIKKDSVNPHFKNKYFDINSLLAEVKPILNKHDLIILQGLTHIDGKLALETKIISDTKDFIVKKIPAKDRGSLPTTEVTELLEDSEISFVCPLPECPDAQKYGSAITYFRRYALQSLLALEAEDDDGNTAKPAQHIVPNGIKVEVDKVKTIKNNDLQF